VMPIPRIEPIIIPAVPLPPPVTQGMPGGPTTGIRVPNITEPRINYPTIEIPNHTPAGDGEGQGSREEPQEEQEDTRDLPDTNLPPLPDPSTIFELPTEQPVIPIPLTEIKIPQPDGQVLSTTASAAFVATTSALAATTALKPVMDSLFKVLKAVFKKVLSKLLRKKDKSWAGVEVAEVQLQSLDRFRFDSSRPYSGPQYPRKGDRKQKQDGKKPQPE